jgi:hypothetical protein
MNQPAANVLDNNKDIRLNFIGDFDGSRAVEIVCDLMARSDSFDRVALGFSHVSQVKPLEIYYLLAQLSMDPRFNTTEISIEGLQCRRMQRRY